MKTVALTFSVVFLFASVAWEGPACRSFKGQPTCCRQCPFKMLPKVGNSCCNQGVEKGSLGVASSSPSQKPTIAFTPLITENRKEVHYRLAAGRSFPSKTINVYLFEEHLIL